MREERYFLQNISRVTSMLIKSHNLLAKALLVNFTSRLVSKNEWYCKWRCSDTIFSLPIPIPILMLWVSADTEYRYQYVTKMTVI